LKARPLKDERARISLPFQLRGWPAAVVDSAGLGSDVVGDQIPPAMRQPVRISDFIQ
jgi:hypothetical protein